MTVAALQANALGQLLSEGTSPARLGRTFQQHVARIVAMPWAITTSEDSRYRGTEGAVLDTRTRLMRRYMDAVLSLTTERLAVRRIMLQVQHMLLPSTSLCAPPILLPALRRLIRHTSTPSSALVAPRLAAPGRTQSRGAVLCYRSRAASAHADRPSFRVPHDKNVPPHPREHTFARRAEQLEQALEQWQNAY